MFELFEQIYTVTAEVDSTTDMSVLQLPQLILQHFCVVQRLSKLVRLVAGAKTGNAVTGSCPDVAAAAAAIGLLVAQQPAARAGLLQLRGLQPLLTLLHQGTLAEQSVAANVLFDMLQGTLSHCHATVANGVWSIYCL